MGVFISNGIKGGFLVGTIEIFEDYISQLQRNRTIKVYLPEQYFVDLEAKFPVLYMHDAQNLYENDGSAFGDAWHVHKTLDKLILEGKIPSIIVVGIDNGEFHRWDEYSPWKGVTPEGLDYEDLSIRGGEGDLYADYIAKSLKPKIDEKYRTVVENTGVAGSSMGGLISLYVGMKYSDIFSYVGAFSTASWFAEVELLNFIENNCTDTQKYYVDTGTHESVGTPVNYYVEGAIKIYDTLLKNNIPQENIKTVVEMGGVHNEVDWRNRFGEFIIWGLS
ncbi:MAG: hypothetical protein ATN36_02770 [Epulopiscium sp. Nele67-Bin005]|nr:MAG: hypothetical protein ATN36_02770 [Epulopiscium sp. Nele67-Bin005]